MNRRDILKSAFAAPFLIRPAKAMSMPAIFVPTFDYFPTAAGDAFSVMSARGIVGTVYADPFLVGQPDQLSVSDLTLLKQCGWEIGGYAQGVVNGAGSTMVDMWVNNRNTANDRLKAIDEQMESLGFRIKTIAPCARSWNAPLANLARGRFIGVRGPIQIGPQNYPVADPMNIPLGGTNSWSATDTVDSLKSQLDALISAGGVWFSVCHRVGPTSDAYTIPTPIFSGFMDYVGAKMASGEILNRTVEQALTT